MKERKYHILKIKGVENEDREKGKQMGKKKGEKGQKAKVLKRKEKGMGRKTEREEMEGTAKKERKPNWE